MVISTLKTHFNYNLQPADKGCSRRSNRSCGGFNAGENPFADGSGAGCHPWPSQTPLWLTVPRDTIRTSSNCRCCYCCRVSGIDLQELSEICLASSQSCDSPTLAWGSLPPHWQEGVL